MENAQAFSQWVLTIIRTYQKTIWNRREGSIGEFQIKCGDRTHW